MATFNINNPPENLTMVDVKGYSSAYGGLVKSAKYAIRITPVGNLLLSLGYGSFLNQFTYLSDSAEMPGRAFMSIDIRYYGPNFKLPFQSQYEDMTITFLCRTESLERQFFDDWMEIINPTNLWDFNYRDSYRGKIEIFQLATHAERGGTGGGGADSGGGPTAPKSVYKWTVHDAYPVIINPQPVTWADDQFQRLSVSFTYTKWTRDNRDAVPGTFRDTFVKGSEVQGLPGQSPPAATAPAVLPETGSGGGGSAGGGFGGGGGGGF
jgi:hypothetical protein